MYHNILPRTAFSGGSVMVWADISLGARTELHIVENKSMNAERYISDILEDYRMPFAPYIHTLASNLF